MVVKRHLLHLALILVAATMAWWLGHVLLESLWALTHVEEGSTLPRWINLLLLPLSLGVAWWLIPARASAGSPHDP